MRPIGNLRVDRCCRTAALLTAVVWGVPGTAQESPAGDRSDGVTVRRSAGWYVAVSDNFRCWTGHSEAEARTLATRCEQLRSRLGSQWGIDAIERPWTPRCDVMLHGTQAAYGTALGRPGEASVGCTRIQFDGDRIVSRRIDLRRDAPDWTVAALPHELTHAVLMERFGRALPPWADEGMAMLSESAAKQETRLADLHQALHRRTTYDVRDLLAVRQLPPPHRRDAYYGQSLALTLWLVERSGGPREFARFLEASRETSIDEALRSELNLDGVAAVEQAWRQQSGSSALMRVVRRGTHSPASEPAVTADGD